MPYLAGITIYPLKSFDPVAVPQTRIVAGGGLEHDREFALHDADGKFINGKRTPKVHGLRASIDWKEGVICLETRDGAHSGFFHLNREREPLAAWFSDYFGMSVKLRRNPRGGFPDDLNAPGPTLIGEATLREVASWYDGLAVSEARIRFRANLEIGDAPAFWEDQLYGAADQVVRFQIGGAQFEGTNPCQRCVVPTRHSQNGEATAEFSQRFRARREETLPGWADRSRFNHFYRLAVNTRVPATEEGKVLRIGDDVRLLETVTR